MALFDKGYQELKRDVREAGEEVKGQKKLKLKKIPSKKIKKGFKGLRAKGKAKERRRATRRREVATRGVLTALGVLAGKASKAGAGRPRGTYKYGMPIHEYKRLMTQKKERYRQYQQEQLNKFRRRGISPEQVRQMQLARTVERGVPERSVIRKGDEPGQMVDDELAFKKWESERTLSPSAQRILLRLRRVQNKGKVDNIRQQRIHEERRIIDQKASLFRAHENMIPVKMDFTGVNPDDNILMAPNLFKEDVEDHILKTKRLNILQTREAGNSLF